LRTVFPPAPFRVAQIAPSFVCFLLCHLVRPTHPLSPLVLFLLFHTSSLLIFVCVFLRRFAAGQRDCSHAREKHSRLRPSRGPLCRSPVLFLHHHRHTVS